MILLWGNHHQSPDGKKLLPDRQPLKNCSHGRWGFVRVQVTSRGVPRDCINLLNWETQSRTIQAAGNFATETPTEAPVREHVARHQGRGE